MSKLAELYDWHAQATRPVPCIVVWPERSVNGVRFPEIIRGGKRLPNGGLSEPFDGSNPDEPVHTLVRCRALVASRTVHAMTPAQKELCLKHLFDPSEEGQELATDHAARKMLVHSGKPGEAPVEKPFAGSPAAESERREHGEAWLIRHVHNLPHFDDATSEHRLPTTELATEQLKGHHASAAKLEAYHGVLLKAVEAMLSKPAA